MDRLVFRRVQMGVGGERKFLSGGKEGGDGGMRGGLVT